MMSQEHAAEFFDPAIKAQQLFTLPRGARQILLVRHGSSTGATTDTVEIGGLNVSDPELSQDGQAQALLVAAHLYREKLSGIFVSPLRRTRQTAAPLVSLTRLTPVPVADLREVYLGDFEQNIYQQAAKGNPVLARMFAEENWDVLPNAEGNAAFAARVRRGIESVVAATEPGTSVVAFSHAGTISQICCLATGSRNFAFTAVDNTSVSRLIVLADGTWRLRSYNEAAHLFYA